MSTQATTEKHKPPTADHGPVTTPVLLLAFPEVRAVPLPPLGVATGRAYFAERGRVDGEMSKNHVRLSRAGSTLRIEDLGSSNGTSINGHKLTPHEPAPLKDGAILRLGASLFVFREAFEGAMEPDPPTDGLVGPWGLRRVRETLRGLRGRRSTTVLIEGETGTGKELVAQAAAAALGRSKPFVAVNTAALARDTIEGHLFGWQRGAFSGADRTDPGLIRAADKGAVFFDEIGDFPLDLQPKLLRVLENSEVLPIGGHQPSKVDVAYIAATNQDLTELAAQGKFRQDLLARFRVRIELPPLRDRVEDLLPLLQALWERDNDPAALPCAKEGVDGMELLLVHDWPANARDVARFTETVMGNKLELRESAVRRWLGPDAGAAAPPLTRETVAAALAANGGDQGRAADALGVKRGAIVRFLKKQPDLKAAGAPRRA